jgi:outer membrane protein OmpA-like peptidoglycan-associated protein
MKPMTSQRLSRGFSSLGSVVALSFVCAQLAGCSFSMKAGGNDEPAKAAEPAPPPPPPPPPPAEEEDGKKDADKAKDDKDKAEKKDGKEAKKDDKPAREPKKNTIEMKKGALQLPGNIVFEEGKATLKADSGNEQVLEQVKLFLDENPQITKLRIEGHTDNVGKEEDNLKLSGERALAIKKWLVEKGVPKERLIAVGFGQTKPIVDNGTEEGRAQNRRTEFKIGELKGKPYLGKDPNGGGQVFEL